MAGPNTGAALRRRREQGFTLVEVIVALLLLEFGVLALLGATAVAARDLGVANRRARAQWLASDRVALLRAQACTGPQAGRATAQGLTETWRVEVLGSRSVISDSVDFPTTGGRRANVVTRSWVWCAPDSGP